MNPLIDVAAVLVAVLAAVRSTWSPCGRSMLSSITPMGEHGRGTRFATSAAWFVTGATIGGACLGGAIAASAALAGLALRRPGGVELVVTAAAAVVAALSDTGVVHVPVHRRQVNELWLDRFRPWVYAGGFGWQIGTGFATYVMTAGLYLLVVLGAVSGQPMLGLAVGTLFGCCRGLAVLLGRRLTEPAVLARFHRRFDGLERWPRAAMIWAQVAIAATAAGLLWPAAAPIVVAGALTTAFVKRTHPSARPRPALMPAVDGSAPLAR